MPTIGSVAQRAFIELFKWLAERDLLPLNRNFGRGRGRPVGRRYLEEFIDAHAHRVTGRVLEFGDPRYRARFPNATVYEVLSVRPGPNVDHVADIESPPEVLRERFDWIVCTQVLEHVRRPDVAAGQLLRLLRPGGGLLFSVPFLNVVHRDPEDYRRFTAAGVRALLEDAGFEIDEVAARGNFATSVGGLVGLASTDFPERLWERDDPDFPYIITARAHRPSHAG